MKKFLIMIIALAISLTAVLCGCEEITQEISGGSSDSTDGVSSQSSALSESSNEAADADSQQNDETQTTDTDSTSSNTDSTSSDTQAEEDESSQSKSVYSVSLVLPDGETEMPDLTDIQAKWTSGTDVYTADFNSAGVAYYRGLDGEYSVTISGLIDGYSYNPNIYDTSAGKDVRIHLIALQTFGGQDGSSAKNDDLALAYNPGVYRIEFTEENQKFYFMFLPGATTGCTYTIQTYADTIADEINPTFYLYFYSNRNLVNGDKGTVTGGSQYNGDYTKNIYCELDLSSYTVSSMYNPYIYVFGIDVVDGEYPRYLDIFIDVQTNADYESLYGEGA